MENTQKKTNKQILAEVMGREELLSRELERKTKERNKALLSINKKGTEEATAAADKGENDFIALSSCVENLGLELDLERDNENYYKQELAKEVLIDLSNKYQGKKAGQKTLGKLYDEFHEKTGFHGYFKRSFYSQKSEFFQFQNYRGRDFYLSSAGKKKFIDENNIIQPLDESCFYVSEKQPTRNTQERLEQLREAKKKLEESIKNYNAAAESYNFLIPSFYDKKNKIY